MLPINHLKRTLDRCCGQFSELRFVIRFLNTSRSYIAELKNGKWRCAEFVEYEVGSDRIASDLVDSAFLTNRLNGLHRTDAGDALPADFDCVPGVEQ